MASAPRPRASWVVRSLNEGLLPAEEDLEKFTDKHPQWTKEKEKEKAKYIKALKLAIEAVEERDERNRLKTETSKAPAAPTKRGDSVSDMDLIKEFYT